MTTQYQYAAFSGTTPIPAQDGPQFESLQAMARSMYVPWSGRTYPTAYEWHPVAVEDGSQRDLTDQERAVLAQRPE